MLTRERLCGQVYMLNIGYGSVKKMLAYQCEQAGAHVREGEITFPLAGPNDILEVVRNTLRPNTRLAIFDHITSNTGTKASRSIWHVVIQ